MKYLKLILKKFEELIILLINVIIFAYFKVKIEKKDLLNIKGIPYLRNKGQFLISKKVVINSRYKFNPIGGQLFSTFIVRENAKLTISEGTGISNSTIICWNDIYIGKNVYIGGDCKIYDTDFHSLKLEKRISNNDDDVATKPIKIMDGAFIGTGCIILKGVIIGENSIVGAGAVVSKYIPPNEVWGGNPAKFIKKLEG